MNTPRPTSSSLFPLILEIRTWHSKFLLAKEASTHKTASMSITTAALFLCMHVAALAYSDFLNAALYVVGHQRPSGAMHER